MAKHSTKRKTQEEFLEQAKAVHDDKYDYSKTQYVNNKTKICVICPKHGEFWITPNHHLRGVGCAKCCGNAKLTTLEYIVKARQVHGDKYGYDDTVYNNWSTKVNIHCPKHGVFWQNPGDHLKGCGCPRCKAETISEVKSLSREQAIERAQKVHGEKYSYEHFIYRGSETKAMVTCHIHGDFAVLPSAHIQGVGCPKCHYSSLERKIDKFLTTNGIPFIAQCHGDKLKWLGQMSLDFYLPQHNIAIECQGIQHYEPIHFFGGDDALAATQERDKRKRQLCEQHGVRLLYFADQPYTEEMITDTEKLKQKIDCL